MLKRLRPLLLAAALCLAPFGAALAQYSGGTYQGPAFIVYPTVSGHCAQFQYTNNGGGLVDSGLPCGEGGSGIDQLTGDVTAGPGTGSVASSVVGR